jgi:hypothetical protein
LADNKLSLAAWRSSLRENLFKRFVIELDLNHIKHLGTKSLLVPFSLSAPLILGASGDSDDVVRALLSLAILLPIAKLGGWLVETLGQPAVLGELLAGMVIGNLRLVGINNLEYLKTDPALGILATLGVILLLFEIGLESSLADLMKVGVSSLLVATIGVALPFALGWVVSAWLLPDHSYYVHAFIGAALCATSVGITARVLRDFGAAKKQRGERHTRRSGNRRRSRTHYACHCDGDGYRGR